MSTPKLTSKLELHGAAATSSPHSLIYLPSPDDSIIYASNCIINIAKPIQDSGEEEEDKVLYNVNTTLRTSTLPREKDCMIRSITTMALLKPVVIANGGEMMMMMMSGQDDIVKNILVCAFSDGSLTLWKQRSRGSSSSSSSDADDNHHELYWEEDVMIGITEQNGENHVYNKNNNGEEFCHDSITDVDGVYTILLPSNDNTEVFRIQTILLTSSSKGVNSYKFTTSVMKETDLQFKNNTSSLMHHNHPSLDSHYKLASYPTSSLKITTEINNQIILAVGTAQPRHNRIHFYTLSLLTTTKQQHNNIIDNEWKHQGSLLGHLGWVTCLDWTKVDDYMLLATGSQDSRIRLWKLHTAIVSDHQGASDEEVQDSVMLDDGGDDDKDDGVDLVEEGEARMHVYYQDKNGNIMQSAVTLEALLIGHEEQVTAVSWRPDAKTPCLISSSMDRSILIWMEENDYTNNEGLEIDGVGNVWAPVTRVGTAGGILGGSIGSSLLGFINVMWNGSGNQIIGHGYGGSIYFWSRRGGNDFNSDVERWRANPCITGHFRGCSDISWEVSEGLYLLSAGLDQTCRLWTFLPESLETEDRLWREVGRPQVHGYDLNTVACIGSGGDEVKHRFVSGADEKEARSFDAPISILKLLSLLHGKNVQDDYQRVDRAFIPSLGLSNRATADDAMEEDSFENSGKEQLNSVYDDDKKPGTLASNLKTIIKVLPSERDLGVISLWPEIRKLYGHQTELVCLATNAGRCNTVETTELLASSCKARDADNAAIRLWDVEQNMCLDILKDGHKSTVTSMSFSSDGKFIASSGKDRRLCLWRNRGTKEVTKFDLSLCVESVHKRIVWSLDFCPSHPSLLCTGSRDGFIKLWNVGDSNDQVSIKELCRWEPHCKTSKKVEPITAIAFAPVSLQSLAILAIGLENGLIEIWGIPFDTNESFEALHLYSIPTAQCHIESVKKLAWQPIAKVANSSQWDCTLASCSIDHGVRIHRIKHG